MLNRILYSFLLLVCAFPASAQWHLGVQAGPNISAAPLKGEPAGSNLQTTSRIYYFAGITGEYHFSNRWGAALGVQYAVRGNGYRVRENPVAVESFRRQYIDVTPVLVYRVLDRLDLQAGVYLASKLGEQFQTGNSEDWNTGIGNIYSGSDFGLAPGLRFHAGKWVFMANAQLGLKRISQFEFTNELGEPSFVSERNRSFQVGLGYCIF